MVNEIMGNFLQRWRDTVNGWYTTLQVYMSQFPEDPERIVRCRGYFWPHLTQAAYLIYMVTKTCDKPLLLIKVQLLTCMSNLTCRPGLAKV